MKFNIINYLALVIDNIASEKYLSKFQEFLLSGAIFTDDDDIAALLCSFRVHGKGEDKYDNVRIKAGERVTVLRIEGVKLIVKIKE